MIKAILLDYNGVIIDDEPLHEKAYQEVFKAEDIDLSHDDYMACLGMDDARFIRTNYQRVGKTIDDDTLQQILEKKYAAYQKLISDEIPLFPGIVNTVKTLSNHFALGIVSMATRTEIESILQKVGLLDCFRVLISAADVTACKPDPMCYNLGFRLVDRIITANGDNPISREEVVVIEDAPPGVRSAKSAGLKVLGVTNTVSADELRKAGADSVTKNLSDWMPETFNLVF
jgi:HAD superfamily hydrolase (TIGR01509 family)